MKHPQILPDGTCQKCASSGGWLCEFHQADGVKRDLDRAGVLRSVLAAAKESELGRIAAMFELESDEFLTRREKSLNILEAQ